MRRDAELEGTGPCVQPLNDSVLRHNPWLQTGKTRRAAQPGVPELRGR